MKECPDCQKREKWMGWIIVLVFGFMTCSGVYADGPAIAVAILGFLTGATLILQLASESKK